jgi:hypothetical protein
VRVDDVFYFSDIGRLDSGDALVIFVNGKVRDLLPAYRRKCLPLVRVCFVAYIQRVKANIGIFRSQFDVVWGYLIAWRTPRCTGFDDLYFGRIFPYKIFQIRIALHVLELYSILPFKNRLRLRK